MADDNIVGAALPQQETDILPMLSGFGEDKVVSVFNPLPQDFRVQYARSLVQPAPLTDAQKFARDKAGLDLSKEQNPMAHTQQFLVLKSGKTINLPGDIAQVAVRQLVTHIIMVRAGKGNVKPISDPYARRAVEQDVIQGITDNVTFMNRISANDYTDKQIEDLNKPLKVEPDEPTGKSPSPTKKT
jgi:hypothetical protein